MKNKGRIIALGLATQFSLSPALAEQQGTNPNEESPGGLQEIIVTAQKRSENLQSVPISVSAVNAELARAQGIQTAADLPRIAPGLVITPQVGNPIIYLRGIGTDQFSGGTEASVATYVDGVYLPNAPAALFAFNSIERIEVLRGPQGTLFGRNASGGLINVITRDPSLDRPELNLALGYGSYDTVEAQAYGNVKALEDVAINLAAYYKKQSDGWGTNIYDGSDIYKDKTYAFRSKQLFEPGDTTRIILSEDYSYLNGSSSAGKQPLPGSYGAGMTPNTGNFYDINFSYPSYQRFKGGGLSGRIEQDIGAVQLVNLTAFRRSTFDNYLDQDATPLKVTDAFQHYRNRTFSNELQLQSQPANPIKWIMGLYYLSMLDELDPLTLSGTSQAANGGRLTTVSRQRSKSYAGFAQITVPIGERAHIMGGLRYTHDTRDFSATVTRGTGVVASNVDTGKSWNSVSYKVAADYEIADQVMLYLSHSKGFKSGQYNPVNPTNPAVNPEKLYATEGGLKSQFLDNRLRANLSAFYYNYKDLQLTQRTSSGLTQVLNAANAEIYGLELSLLLQPVPGLTLRGDMAYLHGRYKDFANAPYLVPSPASCTPTPHSTGAPTGGNTNCSFDASGNIMPRSPKMTYNLGAHYDHEIGTDRSLSLDLSAFHTSGSYFYPDNRFKQRAYMLVNGEIGLNIGDYSVRFWGRNIFDKKYYSYLHESTGDYGTPGAPQTIGVTLAARFH